jgi:hypothetical protein
MANVGFNTRKNRPGLMMLPVSGERERSGGAHGTRQPASDAPAFADRECETVQAAGGFRAAPPRGEPRAACGDDGGLDRDFADCRRHGVL